MSERSQVGGRWPVDLGARPSPAAGTNQAHLGSRWSRAVLWWDIAFYAVVALTLVGLALGPDGPGDGSWTAFAACLVLLVSYVALGRRAARSRDQRLASAYLTVLVVATTVAVASTTVGTFLLFAAFSQVWMLSEKIWGGIAFTTVLTVSVTVAMASWVGLSTTSLIDLAPQMGVILVFSIGLGLWVASSMRHTIQLAETVDELQATREALAEAHRAEGVAAERERMAQEIHDTLAQGFTSIVMLAQTVRADVAREHVEAAEQRLELIERTARDNLAEARALVAAFSPVGLTDSGIAEALGRLADRFGAETAMIVHVELPGEMPPVDREREVVLLRAAQEALTNVRRHAQASAATLSLTVDGDLLNLEVTDNGLGIETGTPEGYGLRGMRARVASTGGSLTVGSAVTGGTRVAVSVPRIAQVARFDGSECGDTPGKGGGS